MTHIEYFKPDKYSLNDFVKFSHLVFGKNETIVYFNHITDIINHPCFYRHHCKLPFYFNKTRINETICVKKSCPLYIAIESFPNFNEDFVWVSFHNDWKYQYAKFVIRKGLEIVEITRDPNLVRHFLNLSPKPLI